MAQHFSRKELARYIVEYDGSEANLAQAVAAFLTETNKTSDLESIMRDVMDERARQSGVVELTARSAHSLSPAVRSEIEQIAKKLYPSMREVLIHEVHDAQLIGGVRLQFANASLDLTVKSRLNRLREAIT